MKFKFKISKWANFYFFTQNLSEWHFSCRKEYNKNWRDVLSTFTPEQEKPSKENIKTNVTACMSTKQAVIAAKAGATYVSLFWARIADMGYDAKKIVTETAEIFRLHNFRSKIIIGSFRQVSQINDALLTGAHVLTIPTNLLNEMVWNPRTESTIQEFIDKWDNFQKTQ